jgi:prepilin peptidase CpaA
MTAPLLLEVLCVCLCAAAAVVDLRLRRIPNALTYPATLGALALGFALPALQSGPAAGLAGLGQAAAGWAALFFPFLLLSLTGALGMGDTKLMGAVGALLGWPLLLWVLVDVLLAGALLALAAALRQGALPAVTRNLAALARGRRGAPAVALHAMPYGLAIFLGTVYAVASRRFGLPNLP